MYYSDQKKLQEILECLTHISQLVSKAVDVCVVEEWLWGGIF